MKNEFFDALKLLETEDGIDADELIEKVKDAMLKAVRKAYPDCEDYISVEIDPKTKKFNVYMEQTVVPDEPTYYNEINVKDARKKHPLAEVGETVKTPLDISKFSRAAALTAKQSIHGDIREINKRKLIDRFEGKIGDIITVTVKTVETNGSATCEYDGTDLYLFATEQIPGETLVPGEQIKVYVADIVNRSKRPAVKITRKRPELVKRLFELEVPEIYDGTVEIKSISREAGSRTKIAVWSNDKNVDPVGACIGPRQSRIHAIVKELGGEKIDIIIWDENPEVFIAKALAPAEVTKVLIIPGSSKSCVAAVPENQLSLAIGNRGQNAKLAARLTGYKIDIKQDDSPEIAETEEKIKEMTSIDNESDLFSDENVDNEAMDDIESDKADEILGNDEDLFEENPETIENSDLGIDDISESDK